MNAQDSLSAVFAKILNEYRIQNNLNPLDYDSNLDSVAMLRLIESANGTDHCFSDPRKGFDCKDGGVRDLHFKFQKTADLFNKNNDTIQIIGENMRAAPEFEAIYMIPADKINTNFNLDTIPIDHFICSEVKDIAESCLKGWIKSPRHNSILLHINAKAFSFKIFRTKHFNLDWLHAVFLITDKKQVINFK